MLDFCLSPQALSYYNPAGTNRDFFDNIIEQSKLKLTWMTKAVDSKQQGVAKDYALQLLAWAESPLSLEPHYSYSFNQVGALEIVDLS